MAQTMSGPNFASEADGAKRIIACIEDPVVIERILTHLDAKGPRRRPPGRRRAGARLRPFG
jgi:hypothetical protein